MVAPIVANGIRAYLIVMIAHLSSMRLAVGADHLVYGWLFFGGLVALLFWVGSKFEDTPQADANVMPPAASRQRAVLPIAGAAVAAVVLAAAGPYLVDARNVDGAVAVRSVGVPSVDGWDGPRRAAQPWYAAAPGRREFRAVYAHGAAEVELGMWLYDRQSAGEELVGALDSALASGRVQLVDNRRAAALATGFAPREIVLREGGADRVIWYWYSVGGMRTASDTYAKLLEAWNTLARGTADSTLIVLTAETSEAAVTRAALADFAGAAADRIDDCLRPGAPCADVR